MGQTLTNGIYLPNEGERNCYSGLAANWNAVDTLKGNYSLHAINVDIHVTAAEKETWNGKADNSALTAHTGDTTIHVTSADKQTWNSHVADSVKHVTAEDKNKWNGKADASALTAHTGDTTIHVTAEDKATWNGKADASALTAHTGNTTIHVTSADKQAWNGKADASTLTAHTGDTTIHVTAEDKQAWNGKQDALSQTQLDAVNSGIDSTKVQQIATNTSDISSLQSGKANDSNVVHKSGNETVGGVKTFTDNNMIKTSSPKFLLTNTSQTGNTAPSSNTASFLRFDGGTVNNFGGVQCEFLTTSENRLSTYVKDITTAKTNTIQQRASSTTATTIFNTDLIVPATDGITVLGNSSKHWSDVQTYKVNTLEPSSLSLPSGNASDVIDISSYLVNLDGTTNTYTAPANGWISISMINCSSIQAYINGLWGHQVIRPTVGGVRFFMPVLKNKTINILIFGGTIDNARFIPCQGNV